MTADVRLDATFDPGPKLLVFLRGVFGADVRYAEPPESFGQGFDTLIYGFRIEGSTVRDVWARPLVIRVYTTSTQDAKARREAAIQRFVVDREYPAITPLAVETSEGALGVPFMILERMPGGHMLERFTRRPWQGRRLFRQLGSLHARLHQLDASNAPLQPAGEPTIDWFLRTLRVMIAASQIDGTDDQIDWLERNAATVRDESLALVHGDFHPLNILYDAGDRPRVIDWSDASIGDRYADVARTTTLMWFARIVATSPIERAGLTLVRGRLQRWYIDAYRNAMPLDPKRFAYWEAAQALKGFVQLAEVHADGTSADLARRLPQSLIAEARSYFDAKVRAFERLS